MKKLLSIAGITAIGVMISGFTWAPDAAKATRHWIIQPVLKDIQEKYTTQRTMMAGMKFYDMHTDQLTDDVRDIERSIRELEKEKEETPNISPPHQRSLDRQIESYKSRLRRKASMLDQATAIDRKILAELTGQPS